jgi:hypothetical protein
MPAGLPARCDEIGRVMRGLCAAHGIDLNWLMPSVSDPSARCGPAPVDTGGGFFCGQPWRGLSIDASRGGDISPNNCPRPIGNIFRDTLSEAWNGEGIQTYRRLVSAQDPRLCARCVNAPPSRGS